MELENKRIFITGGTGFIGKTLVSNLDNGSNELLVLTRKTPAPNASSKTKFIVGDLSLPKTWKKPLEQFNPDSCVHLAWTGIPNFDRSNCIKNLNQGINLSNILANINCQNLIITGSLWEYGAHSGKLTESLSVEPTNLFTAAKIALHYMSQHISKESNMRYAWARLFYVYGPNQREGSLIPNLFTSALQKENPPIKDPSLHHDFIYVNDVADAITRILSTPTAAGIFNIGSGRLTSIFQIAKYVYDKLDVPISELPIATHISKNSISPSYADITKITSTTGWIPTTSISDGINYTLDYLIKKCKLPI